jgi:two-component system, OmpR family, sensor kinase
MSLGDAQATLRHILLVVALASAAVLVTLLAVAVWVLRHGVSPLTAMAETAGAIAAGDLSRRVEQAGGRTEAGQLGSALNRMLEQIEEAFRVRGESEERLRRFVADASHELRTPLTSIRGYAELWRRGGLQSPEELADAMRRMEDEAQRMGALVDDLLLLARLDEGRPVELRTVRLDLLVADAVRDAQAVEPGRPIDLEAEPAAVLGDEHRLRQVVGNLLANVRVHTPAGTPVHVTIAPRDGKARLEVADEGPGLPPEVASRVFERFFRGDASRTRARGGTGLGLSIVAAVAEAHGGRVAVDTAPGKGARFIVEIPLNAVPAAAPVPSS